MSFLDVVAPTITLDPVDRPHLDSFDSGEECSLAHFMQVYMAVERADHELDGYLFDDACLRVAEVAHA